MILSNATPEVTPGFFFWYSMRKRESVTYLVRRVSHATSTDYRLRPHKICRGRVDDEVARLPGEPNQVRGRLPERARHDHHLEQLPTGSRLLRLHGAQEVV